MNERLIGSAACSACKFAVADARGTLACRRMPPVAAPIIAHEKGKLPQMVGQTAIFPQVHPAHWCGEFARSALSSYATQNLGSQMAAVESGKVSNR